jgi:hypothetical protein
MESVTQQQFVPRGSNARVAFFLSDQQRKQNNLKETR